MNGTLKKICWLLPALLVATGGVAFAEAGSGISSATDIESNILNSATL